MPFHSLRHTFGTVAADAAESPRQLQEWLGHADLKTTAKYLHYRSRGGEAARLTAAFQGDPLQVKLQANGSQTDAGGFHPDAPAREETPAPVGVSAEPDGSERPL